MTRGYVEITKGQFDEFMKPYKAGTSIRSKEGEIIYRIPVQNDLSIWVYSSVIASTGISRSKGEDAIRTVMMYQNRKAVMKSEKTLRTATWKKNLRLKIRELSEKTTNYKCPWGHALVKRKRVKGKGSFIGCSMFPECTYIHKGEKPLAEVFDPDRIPPKLA